MDSTPFITVSHDSSIMTSSSSQRPRRWGLWLFVSVLILGLLVFIVFLIGLTPSIAIPTRPLLLMASTPARLSKQLSLNDQELLPAPWRAAIRSKSHWPVLFGLTREDDRWNGFVIGPAWAVPTASTNLFQTKSRFVRRLSETAFDNADDQVRYPHAFTLLIKHPSSLFVARIHSNIEQVQDFNAFESNGLIQTDLPFERPVLNQPLKRTDLSLNLSDFPLTNLVLNEWTVGPLPLTQFPAKPNQISLLVNENRQLQQTQLVFANEIDTAAKAKTLVQFGIGERQPVTLPDNSTSYERLPLKSVDNPFTTSTPFGQLTWSDNAFTLGASQQPMQTLNLPCPSFTPILHLSSRLVSQLIEPNKAFPTVNLGESNGTLAICIEK